ncbi:helicase-exonuclease AddAB subunit AddA [Paenibacillus larvae]|uniref:helicase-exonuclease AddAB subunit AddA n=1 Tax=Paenibacillus larvae TaxID=1464 RepID=UPI0022820685|nr:helicase-exonuclease AddAB subunit AddA [Paenibacillus larvae]MCY9509154.1 helicase-exonuclease AddAB subunit AddA [Paenibacillus larvae]MCY9524745.1 helicase-exonuclease AddAB subunit AddA [Paenibacillus larvae]
MENRTGSDQSPTVFSVAPVPKPPGSTWTDDQWNAITGKGKSMLIAAAAGSGKTAVLVERIIRRISDEREPADVDRLLVATFTKAAASEMKERIREALEKELLKRPQSPHLRRQLALMGRANITTLHSFCLDVIRRHFASIHLDPVFRISGETETELMRQDVLEELMEEYYENSAEDSPFWKLVDSFGGEHSDSGLVRLVQKLYDESRSHPWPDYWLKEMADLFGPPSPVYPESDQEPDHMALSEIRLAMDEAAAAVETAGLYPVRVTENRETQAKEKPETETRREGPDLSLWQQSILHDVLLELKGAKNLLQQAKLWTEAPGGPLPYLATLDSDLELINTLLEAAENSWEAAYRAFQTAVFGKLKPCRGDDLDKELQEAVKQARNEVKDAVFRIKEEIFTRTQEEYKDELKRTAPVLHHLVRLVIDFAERYQQSKADKGLVDFADLEHYCLAILRSEESTPERMIPSSAALDYQEQFAEVLLDEYQDTNRVQESIVSLISKEAPGNRFMVGDVKQSIYRFRLAEPGLFLSKYKSYTTSGEGEGKRVDLARNFRSRRQVVDAVNFLFRQIMQESVGEIAYDIRAELVTGANYPETGQDLSVEMMLVDRSAEEQDEFTAKGFGEDEAEPEMASEPATSLEFEAAELETAQLEARAIALKIRRLLGTEEGVRPFQVFDKRTGELRPATFRDIVILLRATQQWAPVLMEELKQQGIPAYADLNTGYFSATEVEIMLSLLKTIDNPAQDIPFAAVLRSPVVQLNADDLAQIRIAGPGLSFYDAAYLYANGQTAEGALSQAIQPAVSWSFKPEVQQKLLLFLDRLESWRSEARQGALADLIWNIYRETGFYDYVGGMPGGLQRQANLRALYDRARQYESTSLRGLFRFLRFVERMKETGGDLGTARSLGEQEDVVRIMSIHKSKGLEFPVVFVAGLAKIFNQRDTSGSFLIHKELGFGPKYLDPDLRVSYPTLPMLAIRRRMKLELLAEEMRVLYVALTRAREKLFLLGTVKSADKLLSSWSRYLGLGTWSLPDDEVARARSYLDWIGPSLIRHRDAEGWRKRIGLEGAKLSPSLAGDPSVWSFTILSPSLLSQNLAEELKADLQQDRLESLRSGREVQLLAEQWRKTLDERLYWKYPFEAAAHVFAKTSVSEMKQRNEHGLNSREGAVPAIDWDIVQTGSGILLPLGMRPQVRKDRKMSPQAVPGTIQTSLKKRPRFMEEKKPTPAERGSVVHAVMQNMPLHETPTLSSVRQTLDKMLRLELLTTAQCETVPEEEILQFFQTSVGKRMVKADWVKREVPFSLGLPAPEVYPDIGYNGARDIVLIQGIIDCLFEDEEGLVMLDYKTDAVWQNDLEKLKDRYRLQLQLYARAVEEIWKRAPRQKYLYFFDGAHIVELE